MKSINRLVLPLVFAGGFGLASATAVHAADVIHGDDSDTYIFGTATSEAIYGYGGNDTVYGIGGGDAIHGHAGNDKLYGQEGHDFLYGEEGDDVLSGWYGRDHLHPGDGVDKVYGNWENDHVFVAVDGWYDLIDCGPGDDYVRLLVPSLDVKVGPDTRDTFLNCEHFYYGLGPA